MEKRLAHAAREKRKKEEGDNISSFSCFVMKVRGRSSVGRPLRHDCVGHILFFFGGLLTSFRETTLEAALHARVSRSRLLVIVLHLFSLRTEQNLVLCPACSW